MPNLTSSINIINKNNIFLGNTPILNIQNCGKLKNDSSSSGIETNPTSSRVSGYNSIQCKFTTSLTPTSTMATQSHHFSPAAANYDQANPNGKLVLNQTLTDSSTTGTGASTKSTNLLSYPMNASATYSVKTYTFDKEIDSGDSSIKMVTCKLNNKQPSTQQATQPAVGEQHNQLQIPATNSDHSLEKSLNTHNTHTQTKNYSDNFLSYSPITPIVDYSNNSDVFSDYSVELTNNHKMASNKNETANFDDDDDDDGKIISNQPDLENVVTYKSIMIIDVSNKVNNHSSEKPPEADSAANGDNTKAATFGCRNANGPSYNEDEDVSVYINEIKFYNQEEQKLCSKTINTIRNEIEKNINNFYLLDDEKQIASYDLTPIRVSSCDKTLAKLNGKFNLMSANNSSNGSNTNSKKLLNNKKSGQLVLNQKRMRRKLKENIFHINNRKGFRKPLNYLRQNHIYCRNNEYKRYEFINTTDMDSMISSVSFNDYQFALDCMNTSDSSSSSSSSGSDTVIDGIQNEMTHHVDCDENSKKIEHNLHQTVDDQHDLGQHMLNKKNLVSKISWLKKSKGGSQRTAPVKNASNRLRKRNKNPPVIVSNEESTENGVNTCSHSSSSSNESKCSSNSGRSSPCEEEEIVNTQNSCAVDLSSNFYINGGEIFDEVDEHPSNEFARADDDYELNDQIKSSDEEFTYSYGDVLSTANRIDEASIKVEEKRTAAALTFPKDNRVIHDTFTLNIHRLPGIVNTSLALF